MTNPSSENAASKRTRIAWVIASLFAFYLLVGYFVVPRIVEHQLVEFVLARSGSEPRIREVGFDPLRCRLEVDGFELRDPQGSEPAIAFEALIIDLRPMGFLNADVALDELALVNPRVAVEIDDAGVFNLAQFVSREEAEPAAIEGPPLIVDIGLLRIEQGEVSLRDHTRSPIFVIESKPLDLEISGFTTRTGVASAYSLDLHIGHSGELHWEGTIGLDPLQSQGQVRLTGLELPVVSDYLSKFLRFEIRDGSVGVNAEYEVSVTDGFALALREAAVDVRSLELVDPVDDAEILSLRSLSLGGIETSVHGANLDSLTIEEIAVEAGRLATRREPDGRLHLVDLLTAKSSPVTRAASGLPEMEPEDSLATRSTTQPRIRIDRIHVNDFQVDFEDRIPAQPVPIQVSAIQLQIEGFESTPNHTLSVDLKARINDAGELRLSGPLRLDPLEATFAIAIDHVALGNFQPYIDEVAKLEISKGTLSTKVDVSIADRAPDGPAISAKGRLQIDDLQTRDRANRSQFLAWGSLRLEGIDYSPKGLALSEIGIDGADLNVVRESDGRSNLETIIGRQSAAGDSVDEASTLKRDPVDVAIRIGRVKLANSTARFSDHAVDPAFSMNIASLVGTLNGLSSEPNSRADIDLAGRIDGTAPVKIGGQLNLLTEDAFTDVSIRVSGVSMSAFEPYSRRFVGYSIDEGKLALDLEYRLSGRRLEAQNRISLNQLSFGERVDSKSATSLPVPFVLALMRDSSGQVAIDLPVRGHLDDPTFSVLGLIGKEFVDLISHIAASPIAFLGGLVGAGGDDLASVGFDQGSSELTPADWTDLERLASVLASHPGFRLQIKGRADPNWDGTALRVRRVEEEIRSAAYQSLSREEQARLGNADQVVLDAQEKLDGLEKLYVARTGAPFRVDAPQSVSSGAPMTPAAATSERMNGLLAERASEVQLGEADWRRLAQARVDAVQRALTTDEGFAAERIDWVDIEIGDFAKEGVVPTELILIAE